MPALRLSDLDIDLDTLSSEFGHLNQMYLDRLSPYYYRRFDQALNTADIEPNETVLEIGGGTGVFLLSLVQECEIVHFSDISRETPPFSTARKLLELADISSTKVKYAVADVTDLPYRTKSFDSIFVLDVLEHVPDERAAISEVSRVTAEGGTAVISAPIEVGIPIFVREGYRFIDGNRRLTESLGELWNAFLGAPSPETNEGHRGYDYHQTIQWLQEDFNQVSIEYCPWPGLGSQFNPTAIISATL